jgi:hypothetical protein
MKIIIFCCLTEAHNQLKLGRRLPRLKNFNRKEDGIMMILKIVSIEWYYFYVDLAS